MIKNNNNFFITKASDASYESILQFPWKIQQEKKCKFSCHKSRAK